MSNGIAARTNQAYSRPARLLRIASWIIAIAFAIFLNMLGSLVIRDLMYAPHGGPPPDPSQFSDAATAQLHAQMHEVQLQRDALDDRIENTRIAHERADKLYMEARDSFRNWIATRQATGDSRNDPELLARTKRLDDLQASAADWQRKQNALSDEARPIDAHLAQLRIEIANASQATNKRYEAATRHYELVVFGWRLALTLPLLVVAVWLFIRFRKSRYWPFVYGFGLFASTAFFVELVPYLPSFGGYIRVLVGVALTVFAGIYTLRAFQKYVERKRAELEQSQTERAQGVDYEKALSTYPKKVCPSCDKPWHLGGEQASYCIHCGLNLFRVCACGGRNFAFFPFCNQCGEPVRETAQPGTAGSDEHPATRS
ncbi:hypothetical protein ACFQ3P_04500 [Paraburkholderia sabiae]|uniref:Double zinc ribbon family protein n=1 Tax=Paraburkholderia sabiae TaxID=273251 RepID=A0ABU9QMF4_9BURK|nr:zinc ribbon domain-containing protein [Paraburkholderia sabiae]WJZ79125.1 hypothetical protein QEN71_34705 [Paraburkholderia sabiae]CAD6514363.1 hypothetical protein LMG24235_00901 [Paraburkholderia sabiae]